MTTKDKVLAGIILLLILYLLFRKPALQTSVTSKLIDPVTGLVIGDFTTAMRAIGEAVVPQGINNDISDSAFQLAASNGEISCPIGYSIEIDPNSNKAMCIVGA